MLFDYVLEGGQLMVVLAVIFFAVLLLATYCTVLLVAEIRRSRKFRRETARRTDWRLADLHVAAYTDPSVSARYVSGLISELESVGVDRQSRHRRRQRADEVEESIVRGLVWPIELLEFLGGYAAKVGLCGTILGLCMHFLVFGTDGSAQIASRAMAVALYTTLGALTIALVAEPTAYALGWIERWIRMDLKRWFRFLEVILTRDEVRSASPPAVGGAPVRTPDRDSRKTPPSVRPANGRRPDERSDELRVAG